MSALPAAVAGRHPDHAHARRTRPGARLLRRAAVGAALAGAVLLALLLLVYATAPNGSDLTQRVEARIAATRATPVTLRQMAPALPAAVLATEDERFYTHDGVDLVGLLRALPHDLLHPEHPEGASTITEQLAKLLYLNGDDRAPWRKLEDMAIAVRLEQHHTKRQILDDYLDVAYFGRGAYGIANASRTYFGIAPSHLSLAQATLLAGLLQDPAAYDPVAHPRQARQRQAAVVASLVREGDVSQARARAVLRAPLGLHQRHT